MSDVFRKLNLKHQREITILNSPSSFESEIALLTDIKVSRSLGEKTGIGFILIFVTRKLEIEELSPLLRPKPEEDPIIWFAYPKGTSKNYTCDFNRDNGWESLKSIGLDTVRQISIDDDWSALRFRNQQFIKY